MNSTENIYHCQNKKSTSVIKNKGPNIVLLLLLSLRLVATVCLLRRTRQVSFQFYNFFVVSIFSPSKIQSSFKNPLNFYDILNYARVLFLNDRSSTHLHGQHISIHARMAEWENKAHYSSLARHFFDKITWIESFQIGENSAVYYCTQLCARFAKHTIYSTVARLCYYLEKITVFCLVFVIILSYSHGNAQLTLLKYPPCFMLLRFCIQLI